MVDFEQVETGLFPTCFKFTYLLIVNQFSVLTITTPEQYLWMSFLLTLNRYFSTAQQTFNCSNTTVKTLKKVGNLSKFSNKNIRMMSMTLIWCFHC